MYEFKSDVRKLKIPIAHEEFFDLPNTQSDPYLF